jgi:hypothetical protein
MTFEQFADFYLSFDEDMKRNVLPKLLYPNPYHQWMAEINKIPCTKQGHLTRASMVTLSR